METTELINWLEELFGEYGYTIVLVTSMVESSPFGWLTPGGQVLAVAGFFANGSELSLARIILLGFLGTWSTLIMGYLGGQKTGDKLARWLKQENRLVRARRVFRKRGWLMMTATLTSNVTRFWMSYVAGTEKINLKIFGGYSALSSIVWVIVWTTVGYLAGGERSKLEKLIPKLGIFAWGLFLLALATIIWTVKKEYKEVDSEEKGLKSG